VNVYPRDFRAPGVIIWSQFGGGGVRLGLGYPGQGFNFFDEANSNAYKCTNGVTSTWWFDGTDEATGVTGWVPACNLV
jgi:hypothetical protein